jgi:hypothetical protein
MRWAGIKTIKRGDVIPIRTGWNQLLEPHDPTSHHEPDDPSHPGHPGHQKYLTFEPGIYLREGSLAGLPSSRHRGRGQLGGRGSR